MFKRYGTFPRFRSVGGTLLEVLNNFRTDFLRIQLSEPFDVLPKLSILGVEWLAPTFWNITRVQIRTLNQNGFNAMYPWNELDLLDVSLNLLYHWSKTSVKLAFFQNMGFIHGLKESDYLMTNFVWGVAVVAVCLQVCWGLHFLARHNSR